MRRSLVVLLLVSAMGTQVAAACPHPGFDERSARLQRLREPSGHAAGSDQPAVPQVPAGLLAMLGLVGLTLVTARHFRRVSALRDAQPVPLSLLVVERLARAAQRSGGVVAAIGIVGVPVLVVMDAWILAIVSTIVGAVGVRRFGIARSVLQMIEGPRQLTAEVLSHIVVVRSPIQEEQLDIAPGTLARWLRHAVPMARAVR